MVVFYNPYFKSHKYLQTAILSIPIILYSLYGLNFALLTFSEADTILQHLTNDFVFTSHFLLYTSYFQRS